MASVNEPNADTMLGTVHGLLMFAQVLAHISPDRELLLEHLKEAQQAGLASLEVQAVNEQAIDGYHAVMDSLRGILERGSGIVP